MTRDLRRRHNLGVGELNRSTLGEYSMHRWKHAFVAIAIIGLCGQAAAANWSTDYSTSLAQAKENKRPLMILFTGSDWCKYCVLLEKQIFKKPAFSTWADSRVELVVCDFPRKKRISKSVAKQNQELMRKFGVRGFPQVVLVSPEEKVIGRLGYMGPKVGVAKWTQHAQKQMSAKPKKKR
jgi:protein disulfide-isomerase